MKEISKDILHKVDTKKLEKIFLNEKKQDVQSIFGEYDNELVDIEDFTKYFHKIFHKNNFSEREIFYRSEINEKYGYKLISGEKRTRQRDIILRLCFVSNFTLDETQKLLKLYKMPQLYIRFKRDALLMMAFKKKMTDIMEINEFLIKNKEIPLKISGVQI